MVEFADSFKLNQFGLKDSFLQDPGAGFMSQYAPTNLTNTNLGMTPSLMNNSVDNITFMGSPISTGVDTAQLSSWDKFRNSFFGSVDPKTKMRTGGWGTTALGLATAGLDAFTGWKQLGVMKDALKFQKDAFSKQFENQRTLTNAELRDRQERRYEASNGAVMSPDAYMKKNHV